MDGTTPLGAFKFATWNIDQARREEDYEATKFDNRWGGEEGAVHGILPQIEECNADILCLQELRNLATSRVTVNELLYQVAKRLGYDYLHAYYGPDDISFALCIFYKRNKFYVADRRQIILPLADEKKPNLTRIALFAKFQPIDQTSGRRLEDLAFWVGCTHFGLEEQEKHDSATKLSDFLQTLDAPFLCAGDFNFFDDRDGEKHRRIMLEKTVDAAYPLANASGTFMGFEHDAFKQPFERMSRLDHVFHRGFSQKFFLNPSSSASAFGDMELVRARKYPSDHLMIVLHFSFVVNPMTV